MKENVLLACVRLVMGVPIVKALKYDVFDALDRRRQRHDPGVPTPVTKPCDARLGPTPPEGWPTLLALRMKLTRELVHRGRAEGLGLGQG